MNTDQRIERLEEGQSVLGTQLTRALVAKDVAVRLGIPIAKGQDSVAGWCLSTGAMHLPKKFFYGLTIGRCLAAAEEVA